MKGHEAQFEDSSRRELTEAFEGRKGPRGKGEPSFSRFSEMLIAETMRSIFKCQRYIDERLNNTK